MVDAPWTSLPALISAHSAPKNAVDVYSAVLVKPGVLGGDKGKLHLPGDFLDIHPNPIFSAVYRPNHLALIVVDEGALVRAQDLVHVQLGEILNIQKKYRGKGDGAKHQKKEDQRHDAQHLAGGGEFHRIVLLSVPFNIPILGKFISGRGFLAVIVWMKQNWT